MYMVALVAAQLLVFNHVQLFGYATPLPFIYFVLIFPLGTDRWNILLWGFTCGLLADITAMTPGVGAFAMTLAALIQPPLLQLLVPKDAPEDLRPGFSTMGLWPYIRYATILSLVFSLSYFLVLSFSFHHIEELAISFVSSWLLTLLLCLIFEGFHKRKNE